MGRRRVEVIVQLFYVFAVVAFAVREAEEPLFEDRIFFIPEREGEAEPLLAIAESSETVFAPTICAAAGVFVRKIFPGIAMRGVIFAHRAPLAFRKVRTPPAPFHFLRVRLSQTV